MANLLSTTGKNIDPQEAESVQPAAEPDSGSPTEAEPTVEPQAPESPPPELARQVFLLKGVDDKLNRLMEGELTRLGFQWVEIPGPNSELGLDAFYQRHQHIIFAVAVLSRDEFFYPKDGKPAQALLQSPQETVFKLGYLVGKLGKSNCFIFYREQKSYRLPVSLMHAMFTVCDHDDRWKTLLQDRLRFAGHNIS